MINLLWLALALVITALVVDWLCRWAGFPLPRIARLILGLILIVIFLSRALPVLGVPIP